MDNNLTVTKSEELQLLEARQEAEFAMSPIGKMVRSMEAINQVAAFYAKSDFVPATFKGKPENCAVAVDMALRSKMNPVMIMQNMYIVHGQPSLSSKLIIAMINNCGQFEPLRWESNGVKDLTDPNFGMRAWTFRKEDVKHEFRLASSWVTNKMVAAFGWGDMWKKQAQQMFMYRTAVRWASVHAPEITMGLLTKEEVEEPSFVINDEAPKPMSATDKAIEAMKKQKEQKPLDVAAFVDDPVAEPQLTEAEAEPTETANPKEGRSLL